MDFALFIVVTAILFIRPTDYFPGLDVNLYVVAIIPCIFLSWPKIAPQLTRSGLRRSPALAFGIGILLAGVLTSLVYRQFETAGEFIINHGKTLLLFTLIVAQVDSPRRLRFFLGCLVVIMLIPVMLGLAHYHGLVHIAAMDQMTVDKQMDEATQTETSYRRFGTTGVFADPNDVCEIINCAIIFSLCAFLNRRGGCTRVIWLAPIALLLHGLAATKSRGGFLALVVGLLMLVRQRFRGTKSLVLGGFLVVLMFVFFAGRQTSISTSTATGQTRLQLWDTAFRLMRRNPISPLIGVGLSGFLDSTGHAAHNAFIQTCAELGFLGATLLFGQYFWCLTNLVKLGSKDVTLPDPDVRRIQPFALAALASFAMSEMSLTNPYALVTYMMLGLATAFIRIADPRPAWPDLQLNRRLVRRIVVFSGLFALGLYGFVKATVRY
jgi:hypothetical protein